MPPKRADSSRSLKRKASSPMVDGTVPVDEEVESSQQAAKKLKKAPSMVDRSSQPKNKTLPEAVEFPTRDSGRLRIVAWNVCGLAASHKKGFKKYVEAEDPDILVLSETKVNDIPVDPSLKARFPYSHWSISEKKTYSGTAILSKIEPVSVDMTLPGHPDPKLVKGRIITLEFSNCYLVGTYVVNAGVDLKTLGQKKEWNVYFEKYIRDLDRKKPVIWTGDLNVAPTDLDLSNAKKNWNKSPGYTEPETTSYKNILDPPESEEGAGKFVDVWRNLHPNDREYTYFSYRFNCREKGLGWRIDMFVLSEKIVERVKMCEIRSEIYGASDHCPLVMEIEGEL